MKKVKHAITRQSTILEVKGMYLEGMSKKEIMNKTGLSYGLVTNVIKQELVKDSDFRRLNEQRKFAEEIAAGSEEISKTDSKNQTEKVILTDDQKIQIAQDYLTGQYSQAQLGERYRVDAKNTINRIIKTLLTDDEREEAKKKYREYKKSNTTLKNKKPAKEKRQAKPKAVYLKEMKMYRCCGLVAGRHKLHINEYIFENSLSSEETIDFKWQEETIQNYLNRIRIEDYAGLCVYLTGIQSVLASLLKVCNTRKVKLILMHYKPETKRFEPQIVSAHKNNFPIELIDYVKNSHRVFSIGSLESVKKLEDTYSLNVCEREYPNGYDDNFQIWHNPHVIFGDSEEEIMREYTNIVQRYTLTKEKDNEKSSYVSILVKKLTFNTDKKCYESEAPIVKTTVRLS